VRSRTRNEEEEKFTIFLADQEKDYTFALRIVR